MRMILFSGAAVLSLAVPVALSAQQLPGGPEGAAAANVAPARTTTTVVTTPTETTVSVDNPGNLAPPPEASMNKTYPRCTAKMQDNCQNSGEGGAPGRSRALKHWPGKPASEGGR
ncbi:MAG: hypothetical protein ABIT09_10670 [Croceibacterium sp.]